MYDVPKRMFLPRVVGTGQLQPHLRIFFTTSLHITLAPRTELQCLCMFTATELCLGCDDHSGAWFREARHALICIGL